jgi:hypothetical protein
VAGAVACEIDDLSLKRPSAALVSGTPAATQASETASRVAKLSEPSSTTSAPATRAAALSRPIRAQWTLASSTGSNRASQSAAACALGRPTSAV